jgi:alpha-mannosidase II
MAGLWDSQRLPKYGMSGKGKSKRRGRSSSLSSLRSRGLLCLIALLLAAVFYFAVEILVGGLFSVSDNKSSVQNLVTLSSSLPSSSDAVAHSGDGYLNKTAGGNVGVAIVDISTKDLYDRITFENKDGGVWKQGWDVQYKGNEWDKEKLKIFAA